MLLVEQSLPPTVGIAAAPRMTTKSLLSGSLSETEAAFM